MTGTITNKKFSGVSFPDLYQVMLDSCEFEDCQFRNMKFCQISNSKLKRVTFGLLDDCCLSGCTMDDCGPLTCSGETYITSNIITTSGLAVSEVFSGMAIPANNGIPPAMDWVHAHLAMSLGVIERLDTDPRKLTIENNYLRPNGQHGLLVGKTTLP